MSFRNLSEDVLTYVILPFLPFFDCIKIVPTNRRIRRCVVEFLKWSGTLKHQDMKTFLTLLRSEDPSENTLRILFKEGIITLEKIEEVAEEERRRNVMITQIYKHSVMKRYRDLSFMISKDWIIAGKSDFGFFFTAIAHCKYHGNMPDLKNFHSKVGKEGNNIISFQIDSSTYTRGRYEVFRFILNLRKKEFLEYFHNKWKKNKNKPLEKRFFSDIFYIMGSSIEFEERLGIGSAVRFISTILRDPVCRLILRECGRERRYFEFLGDIFRYSNRLSLLLKVNFREILPFPSSEIPIEKKLGKVYAANYGYYHARNIAIKKGLIEAAEELTRRYVMCTRNSDIMAIFSRASSCRYFRHRRLYKALMSEEICTREREEARLENGGELFSLEKNLPRVKEKIVLEKSYWNSIGIGVGFIRYREYNEMFVDFITNYTDYFFFDEYELLLLEAIKVGNVELIRMVLEKKSHEIVDGELKGKVREFLEKKRK